MAIPELDDNGDLPEGAYQATLDELLERFGGGGVGRQEVARRLARLWELAISTGNVERFVVFGSFVSAKAEPGDVDVFLVLAETFDVDAVEGDARAVFSHDDAERLLGASVFWVTRSTSAELIDSLLVAWQTKRDSTRRGIVEVIP